MCLIAFNFEVLITGIKKDCPQKMLHFLNWTKIVIFCHNGVHTFKAHIWNVHICILFYSDTWLFVWSAPCMMHIKHFLCCIFDSNPIIMSLFGFVPLLYLHVFSLTIICFLSDWTVHHFFLVCFQSYYVICDEKGQGLVCWSYFQMSSLAWWFLKWHCNKNKNNLFLCSLFWQSTSQCYDG